MINNRSAFFSRLSDDVSIHIISPHIDDAFYSLSGAFHFFENFINKITIYNIFSETCFTVNGYHHDARSIRKKEETNAQKVLNMFSSLKVVDIGLPDLSLRDKKISTEKNGVLQSNVNKVLSHLPVANNDIVFVPAGVGEHEDHLLIKNFYSRGEGIRLYYQEFPYFLTHCLVGSSFRVLPTNLDLHIKAIACFESQIPPNLNWELPFREYVKKNSGLLVALKCY